MQHMKFYGAATVGTKGQIVIPAEARNKFNIVEGDKLLAMGMPTDNGIALFKADSLDELTRGLQQHLVEMQQLVDAHKGDS